MGRLLGLSDGAYAQSLYNWRRSYLSNMQLTAETSSVEAKMSPALNISQNKLDDTRVVPQLHKFMQTIATSSTPIFPQVNVRRPMTSSTRPPEQSNQLDSSADPLHQVAMIRLGKEK